MIIAGQAAKPRTPHAQVTFENLEFLPRLLAAVVCSGRWGVTMGRLADTT
jgi:hypothetical protein